jgi:hypothetical protein
MTPPSLLGADHKREHIERRTAGDGLQGHPLLALVPFELLDHHE